MSEQWQMCYHLSSTGNKDMSELIFTLPTHPNSSHSLCASHMCISIFVRTFMDMMHHAVPKVNSNLNCKSRS